MKFLLIFTFVSCALGLNIQRMRFDGRIVGGNSASLGQFPYSVSLQYFGHHYCGGSIINQRTILTAAHCTDGKAPSDISVYAGSNDLSQGGVTVKTSIYTMHENWNAALVTDDISIIALDSPLQYSNTIRPIQVESNNIGSGVQCVMSGWGILNNPAPSPSRFLQYFELNVTDLNDCKDIFSGSNYPVLDSNICAMSRAGQGICGGDTGGPLSANGKQIGVASWGVSCALGFPDVYTREGVFLC